MDFPEVCLSLTDKLCPLLPIILHNFDFFKRKISGLVEYVNF